jgi:hypothetical protein
MNVCHARSPQSGLSSLEEIRQFLFAEVSCFNYLSTGRHAWAGGAIEDIAHPTMRHIPGARFEGRGTGGHKVGTTHQGATGGVRPVRRDMHHSHQPRTQDAIRQQGQQCDTF